MIITSQARIRCALAKIAKGNDPQAAELADAVGKAVDGFGSLPLASLSGAGFPSIREKDDLAAVAGSVVEILAQAADEAGLSVTPRLSDGAGIEDRCIWFDDVPARKCSESRTIVGQDGGVLFSWTGPLITACGVAPARGLTFIGDESGKLMWFISDVNNCQDAMDVQGAAPMVGAVRDIHLGFEGRFALCLADGGAVELVDTVRRQALWSDDGWCAGAITPLARRAVLAASNGRNGKVRVVSARDGVVRNELVLPGAERIDKCAISDDGDSIAVAGVFSGEQKVVGALALGSDVKYAVGYKAAALGLAIPCGGSPVVLLSTAEFLRGSLLTTPIGWMRQERLSRVLDSTVKARALSIGGDLLVIATASGRIELWDTAADKHVWSDRLPFCDYAHPITSCAISNLGRRIALNLGDEVRLYDPIVTAVQ